MSEHHMSRHERALANLETAIAADPRECPFGMYVGDDDDFGPAAFHWYSSADALFTAIAEDLPYIMGEDDDDDVAAGVRVALTKFDAPHRFGSACRQALQSSLRGVQRFHWHGEFVQLCKGDIDFAKGVRANFREVLDEEAVPPNADAPVCEDELDDFIGFLQDFGL